MVAKFAFFEFDFKHGSDTVDAIVTIYQCGVRRVPYIPTFAASELRAAIPILPPPRPGKKIQKSQDEVWSCGVVRLVAVSSAHLYSMARVKVTGSRRIPVQRHTKNNHTFIGAIKISDDRLVTLSFCYTEHLSI